MSDSQLRSEITQIVKSSGFKKSKNLICPIMKIMSIRHMDVPLKQIHKVTKSIF